MARRGDSIGYGFAVGRVMVLRTRLLNRATYERLLDAPTLSEQKRVLSETHFGRFIEGVRTASEIERAVDESLRDLYEDFLERAGLPAAVVAYFRTGYDFAALKGVLKARVLGVEAEFPPVALGSRPLDAFKEPELLPGELGRTAAAVLAADPVPDAESVDAEVDRAMFSELARFARTSRIELLVRLAERESDIANAKILLRCAIARRSRGAASGMLVPGGRWNAAGALELVARPQELAEAVIVARVLPAAPAEELLDPARLDILSDAAIARLASEAAHMPIGPEPVLGYVLARRAEAVSVRSVLVGRLAGVPRDVVAGRLRGAAS